MEHFQDHLLKGCLYFTANQLARSITKLAEDEFRITGLSPTYAFLMIAVNEKQGISQKELGEVLHITPSTVTRFIEKLQAKGLVYAEQKGRMSLIYSTDKGKELQPDIEKAWLNLYDRYSNIIGEQTGIELTEQLFQISNQLEDKHK
ncbi:MarR family transcriptional regulator [Paenibacillus ihbetae]|uniref:MarR family transcriptional regulator n=1 Tax=Paenibacillus ihbetae TaxID=1870820 RepID=A0A1B2DUJ3_9BACL|nr:MarR family transcriptional regulator [Paenibacillus ihbetae]ANY71382.1 MarR family transcriptional regulator [Paenibacillus ihbetae]